LAFAQWEFFYAHATQQAYVDVSTPVVGTGSLRLVGSADGTGAICGRWAQASNRGFRQGRVSTLVQPVAGVAGQDMYGVYGATSQDDLTGTTGTAYAALLVVGSTPDTWEVRLVHVTAGFGSALTVLQTTPVEMAFGQTLALQLQWLSESSFGTALRVATGRALDYSDLVARPIVQEPGVLLQSSAGEGPMAVLTASGDCRFDQSQNEEM
jgi:hypothetical protein